MLFILATYYVSILVAALIVEFLFNALGLIPAHRAASISELAFKFNYTTVLIVIFLALAGALVYRFMRTGGPDMLRMMDMPPGEMKGMHGMKKKTTG